MPAVPNATPSTTYYYRELARVYVYIKWQNFVTHPRSLSARLPARWFNSPYTTIGLRRMFASTTNMKAQAPKFGDFTDSTISSHLTLICRKECCTSSKFELCLFPLVFSHSNNTVFGIFPRFSHPLLSFTTLPWFITSSAFSRIVYVVLSRLFAFFFTFLAFSVQLMPWFRQLFLLHFFPCAPAFHPIAQGTACSRSS